MPKLWQEVEAGDYIRFATPVFIRHGQVVARMGESLEAQMFNEPRPRVISHAAWYYAQDPAGVEHLVVLDEHPGTDADSLTSDDEADQVISVGEACELIKMDPKQLRRHIRRGALMATMVDGRWHLSRSNLMEVSAKRGWL